MNIKSNLLVSLTLGVASAISLTGCVYDDINDYRPGNDLRATDGLVFDLAIPAMDNEGSSSPYAKERDHGEEWEVFIDQAKFRVLFFDKYGNFLFQVDPQFITLYEKGTMADNETRFDAYRVNLPKKYLFPEDRDPVLAAAIEKAIMDDGFKVAVLANWPNFVEGYRDQDYTGDEYLVDADVPTNLDFEFDPNHIKPNSKLEYLSHCIYDNVYGDNDNDAYQHLINPSDDKMGVYSSWVSYLYKSQRQAENFIRAGRDEDVDARNIEGDVVFTYKDNVERCGCDPANGIYMTDCIDPEKYTYNDYSYTRTVDLDNIYKLENIWRLFNFSAGDPNICPFKTADPKYNYLQNYDAIKYWHHRNRYVLIRELNKVNWSNGNSFEIKNHAGETLLSSKNTGCKYVAVNGNDGGYLTLPSKTTSTDYNNIINEGTSKRQKEATNFIDNGIHFKAYGEGILRIRAKAKDGSNAKLAVMVTNPDGSAMKVNHTFVDNKVNEGYYYTPSTGIYNEGEFMIDPSSKLYLDIYIGAIDGDVDIYEIEYMRSRHIYDSARNAIMPSVDYPIPMYGVQNFEPIRDFIVPDHAFNLSDRAENMHLDGLKFKDTEDLMLDKYPFKFVYLLRSVAKIELRFKKSVFRNNPPEHIMMRVMNRTARCEPMDVINPTEWIWFGDGKLPHLSSSQSGTMQNPFTGKYEEIPEDAINGAGGKNYPFVGVDQEFNNIIKFGPLHADRNLGMEGYKKMTTWFYGTWANHGDTQDENYQMYFPLYPWNFNGVELNEKTDLPYPRVFNTRIDRSDYCRFHHVPNKVINGEEYIVYIMYSPEKNIDDADSKGDLTVRPKIQHIEMRFEGMNEVMNFDDNDCYRLYFTDYASANGKKVLEYYRDGSITHKDAAGNTVYDHYDYTDAEQYSDEFLTYLQPVVRNCHYIFTINSVNDAKADVRMTVCGAASRKPIFDIY